MARKGENNVSPLAQTQVADLFISLTLDTRRQDCSGRFPLALRVYDGTKIYYHRTGDKFTVAEYVIVQKSAGRGRPMAASEHFTERPFDTRNRVLLLFDSLVARIKGLAADEHLSVENVKLAITGSSEETSFYTEWDLVASSKKLTTCDSYLVAKKSFMAAIGHIDGFKVPKDALHKWRDHLLQEGKSKTTVGIYLRACKVVWNHCIEKGYIPAKFYPFGKKNDEIKVSIPKGATRKNEFLPVERMQELYEIFCEKKYPEGKGWAPFLRDKIHRSLGVFLAQYLCNGFNLADAARLTYTDYYFRTGEKAFQFIRHKTGDRTDEVIEVIIPIIPQLRRILDEIAAEPQEGALVFPFILSGATSEREMVKRIAQENSNIKDRMEKLFKAKGWQEAPSGTWCRHSFATNLTHAGIPHDYISESMAHSQSSKDVTSLYIAKYPLETQLKYNARLLATTDKNSQFLEKMASLSLEQQAQVLKLIGLSI